MEEAVEVDRKEEAATRVHMSQEGRLMGQDLLAEQG